MRDKWQVLIRKKNHPHITKTFAYDADATKYAGEAERNIEKGLFVDMSEANQTRLKDVLERYRVYYIKIVVVCGRNKILNVVKI